jgi:hypothetical protein
MNSIDLLPDDIGLLLPFDPLLFMLGCFMPVEIELGFEGPANYGFAHYDYI